MKRLLSLIFLCATAAFAQYTIPQSGGALAAASGGGGSPVTEIQAFTHSSGYASGTTRSEAWASNLTAGSIALVAGESDSGDPAPTLSISSSGAGCPTSWTQVGTTESPSTGTVTDAMWYGVSVGGACTATVTSTASVNMNVTVGEYNATGVDSYGENGKTSGTTLTVTAGSATSHSQDWALLYLADNGGVTAPAATGWSLRQNSTYHVQLSQPGSGNGTISSGTTVSAALTGLGSSDTAAIFVVLYK